MRPKAYRLYKQFFRATTLRSVYENKILKSRAIGSDGISHPLFQRNLETEIKLILKKVESGTYKFTPYKQKLISKGANKYPRIVCVPTIRDRLTLRLLNSILVPVFSDAVIRKPHVHIKEIANFLATAPTNKAFVRIDIKEFYPSISREILLTQIRRRIRKPQILNLINGAIKTQAQAIPDKGKGIPQGLSVSNILSSINLLEIDRILRRRYPYFRYVDDMLMIVDQQKSNDVFNTVKHMLFKIGLQCHELDAEGKSAISSIATGIEYLGFRITNTKVSVRKSSYRKMFENLLAVFTNYKHAPENKKKEKGLILRLNLKITGFLSEGERYGWLFFFSQINDIQQLARLDQFVASQLKKRGLDRISPSVKKFVRAYHHIRFNLNKTKYIPKFDDYDVEKMIEVIADYDGKLPAEIRANLSKDQIEEEFKTIVRKQKKILEKDLIEARS